MARDPDVHLDKLPESFVQDIWGRLDFRTDGMRSVQGKPVRIRHPGILNRDSGPDFLGARVQIDGVDWVGDVEVHKSSEEWYRHGHHRDPRYNSVILHVTLVADLWTGSIHREDGSTAPEVILAGCIDEKLRTLLFQFRKMEQSPIACSREWASVPTEVRRTAIERMAHLRLLRRSQRLSNELHEGCTPSEVLYKGLFAALGYSKNEASMTELAARVPLDLASRYRDPLRLEAMYLGMAGLIPAADKVTDVAARARVVRLTKIFRRLKPTISARPMLEAQWKFFRLRPSNFPPIRIAQAGALLAAGRLFADEMISTLRDENPSDAKQTIAAWTALLRPPIDSFWQTHYRLDRASARHSAQLGVGRIRRIIVNVLLPLMLAMAASTERRRVMQTCSRMVGLIPAETDELIRSFEMLGESVHTARTSQGLHELHTQRCIHQRCLRCDIGRHILRASR
ncbi:MAG: DUF2851 family protein [Rhodothermales bacterium]|nr:DUF2851 family protein [Rhodothermales bacterium]